MAVEAEELRPDLVIDSHGDGVRHEYTKDGDELSIDKIRSLAIDAVEAARSGHPGSRIALAPVGNERFVACDKEHPDLVGEFQRVQIVGGCKSHSGARDHAVDDSMGVGEDGPTHQPVEHLDALRGLPVLPTQPGAVALGRARRLLGR